MSSKEFKVGDRVKLKSGSPVMVVSGINHWSKLFDEAYVVCSWTDKQGRPHRRRYHPKLLVKA